MKKISKKYLLMLALVFGVILSLVFACVFSLKTVNTDTAASTYNKETGMSAAANVVFDHEFWVYGTANNNITLDYMSGTGGTRTTQGTGYTPATCMTNLEAIRLNAINSAIHFSGDSGGAGTLPVTSTFSFTEETSGNIYIDGNLSTSTNSIYLLTNNGTNNLFITGGTISAGSGGAIHNLSTGEINISGGTVSATSGIAIYIAAGAINISGGTVSATTGRAIYSYGTGKITISQPTETETKITSVNNSLGQATIYIHGSAAGETQLDIRGGTIQNTTAISNATVHARVIYFAGTGSLDIRDGTILHVGYASSNSASSAIFFGSTGTMDISGGTISATFGSVISSNSAGKITVSQPRDTETLITTTGSFSESFGVVYLTGGTAGKTALEVKSGTIKHAYSSAMAITNHGVGTIDISGGTVSAPGRAVSNNSTGAVNISGGTVSANTGAAIYNNSTGKITISQPTVTETKITSTSFTSTTGTIYLYRGTADQTILDIQGGTIENTSSSADSRTIYNNYPGTVDISGGTVSANGGRAIHNQSTGAVNISGGTVSANTGIAIYNVSTGKITISQSTAIPTIITSTNVTSTLGTIYLAGGMASQTILNIQGGIIQNTALSADSRCIYNAGAGTIDINNGSVSADTGRAIHNHSTGTIDISGGTVSADVSIAIYNNSSGKIIISQPTATPTIITSANVTSSQGTIYLTNATTAA